MPNLHADCALRRDRGSVAAAIPPVTPGLFDARKWIAEALGGAARCRRITLRQRRVAALVIALGPQAKWKTWRVGLGRRRTD